MATTPVANLKIKLDGEKEYKAAVSEINATLRRLDSELKKTDAQFADNADSIEALSQKHGTLSEKVTAQEKKVDELRKAFSKAEEIQKAANKSFEETASTLDKSSDEYAEMVEQLRKANMQADKWATSLNTAEAELAKMQGELDKTADSLENAKEPAAQMAEATDNVGAAATGIQQPLTSVGDALTDVAGKFGVQLPESASKAASALSGVNAGAALAVTGVGLLVAAVVKAEKALSSATKDAAEYAKEIRTLASITGMSTDGLQEFDYAAEMIGVSSDRIRDSLKETTNKMQEARDGNEATALAYQKLGVSITDANGQLRSAQDVFYDTIDALGKIQNQTERDAIAMDLMSESAQELNPLIDIGSEGLKKYAQEAHDMGYVLDNDALASLAAVDDAQQKLLKSQEAVTKQISAEFAPYMAEALGDTADFILKIGKAFAESGIVEDFGSILASATAILEPIGELVKVFLPDLEEALRPVAEAVALIADTVNLLVGLLTLNGDRIKTALGLNLGSGQMSNQQKLYYRNAMTSQTYVAGQGYTGGGGYIEAGTGRWVPYNASGTDYFYGGRTLVGENGPEEVVLPRGSRITSASETRYSGAPVVHVGQIVIDAKNVREFNDVVRIMMNERISTRMEAK